MILSSHVSRAGPQTTGDASPARIPGLAAWYDAAYLNLADGDPVGTWPDLSGNGFDLTQGTTAAKPAFVASGYDGRPAIFLDGVDDCLASQLIVGTALDTPNLTAVASWSLADTVSGLGYVVFRYPGESPYWVWRLMSQGGSANEAQCAIRGATLAKYLSFATAPEPGVFHTTSLRATSAATSSVIYNHRSVQVSGTIAELMYDSVGNNDVIRIGNNSAPLHGQVRSVSLFNRELTAAELAYLGVQMP